MVAMRSSLLLVWAAAAWITVLPGAGYAATINISLHMEPPDPFPLCPGVHRIELHCVHTRESHNPGWRIRGEGLPMYGYARLGQGLLQNHKIITDTDTVEVLQIDPVMSSFTYYCLYVVLGEEVITEPITLNVIDLYKAVTGLQVSTGSEAVVHWNHTDECGMAAHYEVVVRDFTGDPVFNKSTTMLMMTLDDLLANGKYEVIVSVIGRDGVRGEPSRIVFKADDGTVTTNTINDSGTPPSTANQGQNVTAHFSIICEVSQLSCSLYALAAVLVVFAGIVILVLVVALFMRGKKLRLHSVSSAKHPAPVYQEQRPVPLQTVPQSYLYENMEFFNVMSVNNPLGRENSSAESGTFV